MNSNQTAAFKALEQAQQALKSGDKGAARQLATMATRLAPELEEVWLLMAALANPQDSVTHLERALQINPNSERAQKGMVWAQKRLAQNTQAGIMAASAPQPVQTEEPKTVVESPAGDVSPVVDEIKPVEADQPIETPAPVESIQEAKPVSQDLPLPASVAVPAPVELPGSTTQPRKLSSSSETASELPAEPDSVIAIPAEIPQDKKTKTAFALPRYTTIALLGIFLCLILALLAWQGAGPAAAFFTSSAFTGQAHGPAWAPANIAKPAAPKDPNGIAPLPTATGISPADTAPTETSPTIEPATPTETPASLAVVLPTDTPETAAATQQSAAPLPTATIPVPTLPAPTLPAPTNPPAPTATFIPTAIAALPTATVEVAAADGASPTPLPTDTGVPFATPKPPSSAPGGGVVASSAGSGHWIDVDLTNQMVYAYDGNTLVNSFLVSTGTWAHPTVTGQYHVYVKYRYTDMSGPGYYLPNVPFTMFFYQGYALHGTYWHSNFGTPMSHGCVNLSIPDSEWLYNFSSVGTLVNVHY